MEEGGLIRKFPEDCFGPNDSFSKPAHIMVELYDSSNSSRPIEKVSCSNKIGEYCEVCIPGEEECVFKDGYFNRQK
jgi:hypothetical protein